MGGETVVIQLYDIVWVLKIPLGGTVVIQLYDMVRVLKIPFGGREQL